MARTVLFCLIVLAGWVTCAGAGRVVVIDKDTRTLSLMRDGREITRFPVSFGLDPVSDKVRAHDLATPEGRYSITYAMRSSLYFRTLGLSYPNLIDAQHGLASGVLSGREYKRIAARVKRGAPGPCGTSLGCGITLHGGGVIRDGMRDWTEGCVALDRAAMLFLVTHCRQGDPVIIFNSGRNLYRLLRPFAAVRGVEADGLPACPAGNCVYEVGLATELGDLCCRIGEGEDEGISLLIRVYGQDASTPVLELSDRNGDGLLSYLDHVRGPLAAGNSPEAVQARLHEAVVGALRAGRLPESPDEPGPG